MTGRRIVSIGIAAALAATAAVIWSVTQRDEVAAPYADVRWEAVAVPGAACGGTGTVQLEDGRGLVSSNRWPSEWAGLDPAEMPNQVEVSLWEPVRYGDIGGDEVQDAIVPIWCTNGGGMAAGQLGMTLVVFSWIDEEPAVMALVTPAETEQGHRAYFDNSVTEISANGLAVVEHWYGREDGTCCPTGLTETNWEFTGAGLAIGESTVVEVPAITSAPAVPEFFSDASCDPADTSTIGTIDCIHYEIHQANSAINDVADEIFAGLSDDARARFVDGEDAWFDARRATCGSRADVFEGGSASGIVAASCMLAQSQAHLEDLNRFLADLEPH